MKKNMIKCLAMISTLSVLAAPISSVMAYNYEAVSVNLSVQAGSISSGAYTIDETNATITIPESVDYTEFLANIDFGGNEPTGLFTDSSCEAEVDGWIATGNILIVLMADGTEKTYTIMIEGETLETPKPTARPGAYPNTYIEFDNGTDTIDYYNNSTTYWNGIKDGQCGKKTEDKVYELGARASGGYKELGYKIDFYKDMETGGDNNGNTSEHRNKTVEFSIMTNRTDADIAICEDIHAQAGRTWTYRYQLVKISGGKVYTVQPEKTTFDNHEGWPATVDSGKNAESCKWYRFAISYEGQQRRIYMNGELISDINIGENRTTDYEPLIVKQGVPNGTITNFYLDDVYVYEEVYEPSKDKPSYTSDAVINGTMTVEADTTASDACAKLSSVSNTPYVLTQSIGIGEVVTGAVEDGNVIIIPSKSGNAYEYITIKGNTPTPEETQEPTPTGAPQPTDDPFAGYEIDFNNGTDEIEFYNGATSKWNGIKDGQCGKKADDKIYELGAKASGGYKELGYKIDFFMNKDTGGDNNGNTSEHRNKTVEFSIMTNRTDADIAICEDIHAQAGRTWTYRYQLVKISGGQVYTVQPEKATFDNHEGWPATVDSGKTISDLRWYRVAISYEGQQRRIYLNGELISDINIGENRTTDYDYLVVKQGVPNGTITNFYIDDVSVYADVYDPTKDIASYASEEIDNDTIVVYGGTTAEQVINKLTSESGEPYIIKAIGGVCELVTGEVSDGNILMIPSESGKAYKYVTIKLGKEFEVAEPEFFTVDGKLNASVNVYVPTVIGEKRAVLILASYNNGILTNVDYNEYTVSDGMTLEAQIDAPTTGETVKLMLLDENMKPYMDAK